MQHVFIVGSKRSPGAYGGYETFKDKLAEYHQNKFCIKDQVACKRTEVEAFELHNARCFKIKVPNIGLAPTTYYDATVLKNCCENIKQNDMVYIYTFGIEPFLPHFQKEIHKIGGKQYAISGACGIMKTTIKKTKKSGDLVA